MCQYAITNLIHNGLVTAYRVTSYCVSCAMNVRFDFDKRTKNDQKLQLQAKRETGTKTENYQTLKMLKMSQNCERPKFDKRFCQ